MKARTTWANLGMLACCLAANGAAHAADITGAWASDAAICGKVFAVSGKTISFAADADMHGSGLIIEATRIRGKMGSCNITSRKQSDKALHLSATCSTSVAVETMQFVLNIIDENRISRAFPGLPDMETRYDRCVFDRK